MKERERGRDNAREKKGNINFKARHEKDNQKEQVNLMKNNKTQSL